MQVTSFTAKPDLNSNSSFSLTDNDDTSFSLDLALQFFNLSFQATEQYSFSSFFKM
jgi:hypothetical protein